MVAVHRGASKVESASWPKRTEYNLLKICVFGTATHTSRGTNKILAKLLPLNEAEESGLVLAPHPGLHLIRYVLAMPLLPNFIPKYGTPRKKITTKHRR